MKPNIYLRETLSRWVNNRNIYIYFSPICSEVYEKRLQNIEAINDEYQKIEQISTEEIGIVSDCFFFPPKLLQ